MYFSKRKDNCLKIGDYNTLEVVLEKDFGFYLDGLNYDTILLPKKYIPKGCRLGDKIRVFIYKDSEDRLIATTETPFAKVGDFAYLKAISVNNYGAFLDWGLMKDLMVPFKEQKVKMEENKSYVVKLYLDPITERIVASSKLKKYIEEYSTGLTTGQKVDLLVYSKTSSGFNAIVDNKYTGLIYKNETYQKLSVGQKVTGFVKNIKDDNSIVLALNNTGNSKFDDLAECIINYMKKNGGEMNITGKSSTETIKETFNTSKRNFKVAIGGLYKKRIVVIEDDKITLLKRK